MTQNTKTYAQITRDTKDPLKRLAHGSRLAKAAAILPLTSNRVVKVLDYGCGDGGFFEHLHPRVAAENLYGFDPSVQLLSEMSFEGATTFNSVDPLLAGHAGSFDVIYCMEVCEHLDHRATFELFDNIRRLAKPDASIIFGVPIETGPSGFIKNIYRTLRGHAQGATFGRAIKSLFGMWIPRATAPRGWIGSHVGFDCKAFSELFKYAGFQVSSKTHLPHPALGGVFNNEVYFVCEVIPKS